MLNSIDYSKYISIDNGRGLLLNKVDITILYKYGFDYKTYTNLSNLIFDIDNYINSNYLVDDDLEKVLIDLSETNYYINVKK